MMVNLLQFTPSLASRRPTASYSSASNGQRFHKYRPGSADTQVGVVKRNALLGDDQRAVKG